MVAWWPGVRGCVSCGSAAYFTVNPFLNQRWHGGLVACCNNEHIYACVACHHLDQKVHKQRNARLQKRATTVARVSEVGLQTHTLERLGRNSSHVLTTEHSEENAAETPEVCLFIVPCAST